MRKIGQKSILFICGFLFCFFVNLNFPLPLKAINVEPTFLKESQAYDFYWKGEFSEAIEIWERMLTSEQTKLAQAEIHSYLGLAYRQIQEFGRSVRHFQKSIEIYRQQPEQSQHLARVLIEIAQTYNELGQGDRGVTLLKEAIALSNGDLTLKSLAYRTLGTAYWLDGNFDKAVENSSRGRDVAIVSGKPKAIVATLNDLTNVLHSRSKQYLQQAKDMRAQGNDSESSRYAFLAEQDRLAALNATNRALKTSKGIENLSTVRAMLNRSELSQENYRDRALAILNKLPPSRTKAELLIKLAKNENQQNALFLLRDAIAISQQLGAKRTQSFALGQLGNVYEKIGRYKQALEVANKGQQIAGQIGAADNLYPLQWLSARIYQNMGNKKKAIAAYQSAIATLQTLRAEIASASPDIQINTKTEIEPIYRQLLTLLLADAESSNSKILHDSVNVMRQFQFSELQSFFGDACLELRQAIAGFQNSFSNSNAAIIHTILLDNLSYTILELPDGSISVYPISIGASQFRNEIEKWRVQLETSREVYLGYRDLSERIYDWLIRPMKSDLVRANVTELIFVNDGLLRNVPMAALHDGKQFLIEQYVISMSLGLNLKMPSSSSDKKGASIFGLSVAVKDGEKELPPLPFIIPETKEVQKTIGGDRFLNVKFLSNTFAKEIQKDLPVIHIATHGEFQGTIQSTFLRAYDKRITLRQLEEFLAARKESVDLLTLSACYTAAGNERAILGLAGIALRSKVKNVVASLWSVDDKATADLIADFYRYLKGGLSKAQALQQAQIAQLRKNSKISHWTAFVAIGS
jgi:CHAT domain-containing protein